MMELKEFQTKALDKFGRWLEILEEERQYSKEDVESHEKRGRVTTEVSNYPKSAWRRLVEKGELPYDSLHADRKDGIGRPIPHACLKVPTGGGKTLLAAAALERLRYGRGLVLWIVPSRAIYEQTLKALRNREHPIRVRLEQAGRGRVRILEKTDGFDTNDVRACLCIMVLTYQSFNRERSRDALKMTQNAGRYMAFFPPSDDEKAHDGLIAANPDLEKDGTQVIRSLINVIKICRPVVILDEAHKTRGNKPEEYSKTVSALNPRLIVELSATPYRGVSNILVNVTGMEMDAEEMIKMPIELNRFDMNDWKYVLAEGHAKLKELGIESDALREREGRYIRPIAVVRVERTGRTQRDGIHVHADDVRDYLLRLGVLPEQIAIKSSTTDELSGIDLLSKNTPIRWIITKAALMEGWDCPFAYMLVILDRITRTMALTQLLGRVLRQPDTRRTQNELLDSCYVFCHHEDTEGVLQYVRNSLDSAGMGDLGIDVSVKSEKTEPIYAQRKEEFQHDIFMPKVLYFEGEKWSELGYEEHILSNIDWRSIQVPNLSEYAERAMHWHETTIGVEGEALDVTKTKATVDEAVRISDFVAPISDVMPNAWHASRLVRQWLDALHRLGKTEQDIGIMRADIISHMRRHVESEVVRQAEAVFREKVRRQEIRFNLEVAERNFRLAKKYAVDRNGNLFTRDARVVQRTLFEPVYDGDFATDLERSFARYLDEEEAIRWWHKVAARRPHEYYVRGWKSDKIWPDFIAMAGKKDGEECVMIYETKGTYLDNPDTEYKKKVFEKLEDAFNCGTVTVQGHRLRGKFQIVFEDRFPQVCCKK